MPMPQARSGGLKGWSCCPHARQLCNQWQHFFQASCEDLLIQFFTLLALLRACKKLVNDRGSRGVWSPSASGQGSLHSMLPLIRPLRFFYPILPIRCNFPVGKSVWKLFDMHSCQMWYCINVSAQKMWKCSAFAVIPALTRSHFVCYTCMWSFRGICKESNSLTYSNQLHCADSFLWKKMLH